MERGRTHFIKENDIWKPFGKRPVPIPTNHIKKTRPVLGGEAVGVFLGFGEPQPTSSYVFNKVQRVPVGDMIGVGGTRREHRIRKNAGGRGQNKRRDGEIAAIAAIETIDDSPKHLTTGFSYKYCCSFCWTVLFSYGLLYSCGFIRLVVSLVQELEKRKHRGFSPYKSCKLSQGVSSQFSGAYYQRT